MKKTTLALAAAVALLTAGASAAQPPPGAADQHRPGMQMRRGDPAQRVERRAQHLRDLLQLRPEQEPALRAFIEATARPMRGPDRMRERPQAGQTLTTPERLDRQRARMAERVAAFERRAEATKRFYAQLSPAQRKAFDAMRPMGARAHRGMGGRHGGHGPRR